MIVRHRIIVRGSLLSAPHRRRPCTNHLVRYHRIAPPTGPSGWHNTHSVGSSRRATLAPGLTIRADPPTMRPRAGSYLMGRRKHDVLPLTACDSRCPHRRVRATSHCPRGRLAKLWSRRRRRAARRRSRRRPAYLGVPTPRPGRHSSLARACSRPRNGRRARCGHDSSGTTAAMPAVTQQSGRTACFARWTPADAGGPAASGYVLDLRRRFELRSASVALARRNARSRSRASSSSRSTTGSRDSGSRASRDFR